MAIYTLLGDKYPPSARRIPRIREHACDACRQSDSAIDLAQQQHATLRANVAAIKIGADFSAPKASKFNFVAGTLWHRLRPKEYGVETLFYVGFILSLLSL